MNDTPVSADASAEADADTRSTNRRSARSPRTARMVPWVLGVLGVWSVLVIAGFGMFASAVAIGVSLGIIRLSRMMLRPLAQPPPDPPEPGELRKVQLKYRCGVCGTEVHMRVANVEEPEPPRHCMEDMDLLNPL